MMVSKVLVIYLLYENIGIGNVKYFQLVFQTFSYLSKFFGKFMHN